VTRRLFFLAVWAAILLRSFAWADDFGKELPKWLALINNGASKEKRLALYNLGPLQYGGYGDDPKIWSPILGALFDPDPAVREAAADFFKTMGAYFKNENLLIGCPKGREIISSLIKALEDGSPRVRAEAARALGNYYGCRKSLHEVEEEKRAVGPLLKRLEDPDPWVRLSAAFSLGELKTEKAIHPLIGLLNDDSDWKNKFVQQEALIALRKIINWNGISDDGTMKPLVTKSRDPYLRREILKTLYITGDSRFEVKEIVLEALGDKDEGARLSAMKLVGGYISAAKAAQKSSQTQTAPPPDPNLQSTNHSELQEQNDLYGYHKDRRRQNRVIAPPLMDAESLVKIFVKALEDPFPPIRVLAVRFLARFENEGFIDPIIGALKDPDGGVQKAAISSMMAFRNEERVVAALAEYIATNGQEAVFATEVFKSSILSNFGLSRVVRKNPAAATALLAALKKAGDRSRIQILSLLGQIDDERVVALFKELLNDPSLPVRKLAAESLEQLSMDPDSLIVLKLNDQDPSVRKKAVYDLWPQHFSNRLRVKELLLKRFDDEDRDVRSVVMFRLAELRDRDLLPLFYPMLNHPDEAFRHAALQALNFVDDPRAIDVNIRMLSDPASNIRSEAIAFLHMKRDPRGVMPLIAVLGNSNGFPLVLAARALGEMGDPRAVEPLIEALKGKHGNDHNLEFRMDFRKSAAEALGKLKDKRGVPPLLDVLLNRSENPSLRSYAAKAIGEIGDPSALDGLRKAVEGAEIGDDVSYQGPAKAAIEALSKKINQ